MSAFNDKINDNRETVGTKLTFLALNSANFATTTASLKTIVALVKLLIIFDFQKLRYALVTVSASDDGFGKQPIPKN